MKNTKHILLIVLLIFINNFNYSQDWTSWYGSSGNFISDTNDKTDIQDDFIYTQLAWASEENRIPMGRAQAERYGCSNKTNWVGGGGSSPIVYNNKVYLNYFFPTGTYYDESIVLPFIDSCGTWSDIYDQFRFVADDIFLCIDATNGKTIWKKVFKSKGSYGCEHAKPREQNFCGVIGDGKFYGVGSSGRIYCLNAENGDSIWESNLGSIHSTIEGNKQLSITQKRYVNQENYIFASALVYTDGVIVFNINNNGTLYGVNGTTGAIIWQKGGVCGGQATPSVYKYGSKKYIVCANESGSAYCIDPQNGNVQWTITGLGYNRRSITVNENYMVLNVSGELKINTTGQFGCYKITPTSFTKLWTYPSTTTTTGQANAIIYKGNVYKIVTSIMKLCIINAETGTLIKSIGSITSAGIMYLIENGNKMIMDYDPHHTDQSFSVITTNPDNFKKITGYAPTHPNGGDYEISQSYPVVNGFMYFRGWNRIYCYDVREKTKILSHITINPSSIGLSSNSTYQFTAATTDQGYNPLTPAPKNEWSVIGNGSIDTNGLFTAPSIGGTTMVVVSATKDSKTVKDTAFITIKQSQSIIVPTQESKTTIDPPFVPTAYATSGLPVHYSYMSGPAIVKNDSVFLTKAPGTIWLIASQAGDNNYFAASNQILTISVQIFSSSQDIQNKNLLSISPNPATDYIKIQLKENSSVRILNCYGYSMNEFTIDANNPTLIDISSYPKGFYFIQIKNSRNFNSIKLIKNDSK